MKWDTDEQKEQKSCKKMAGKEPHSSECVRIYPLMWDEEEKTPLIPSVAITIDGGEIKLNPCYDVSVM